jgi:hypothetical protein
MERVGIHLSKIISKLHNRLGESIIQIEVYNMVLWDNCRYSLEEDLPYYGTFL